MKELITKIPLKLSIILHNQRGIIFPYVFSVMLLASSFLLVTFEQETYQKEQLKLIETQQQIQNLIQAATFDFKQYLDQLDISSPNSIEFSYVTGNVNIEYESISEQIVQLKLVIDINGFTKPYMTYTKIHV